MPIMNPVTANGTTATVNFPDLSTLTAGTPGPSRSRASRTSCSPAPTPAGNVQLHGARRLGHLDLDATPTATVCSPIPRATSSP